MVSVYRLRKTMGQRYQYYLLSGIIELDNAYFGSPKPNGKRGRGTAKASALVAVSLTEEGRSLFLKIQFSKLDTASVAAVARHTICPGSEIHSNALDAFQAALREKYAHRFRAFDKGNRDLRWVHTSISNIKAFIQRTYHGLGKKYLQSYFDEFLFRFNRRLWPDQLFPDSSMLQLLPVSWGLLTYPDSHNKIYG